MPNRSLFITTPIYYTNGSPHIGHAYTTILASAYSRHFRLHKHSVNLITGTDEHGQKIQEKAKSLNIQPQELVDKYSSEFFQLFNKLLIEQSNFVRTTSNLHKENVIRRWNQCIANNDIYLSTFSGLYCVGCESFKTPKELVNNQCPDHLKEPKQVEEECYFFRLSKYKQRLLDFINNNPDFIQPNSRRNEVLAFIQNEDLKDIPVSRTSFTWGIPVPNNPSHVIYVWFDALVSYLDHKQDNEEFVHFLAKDILKFHAIYWTCFLFAFNIEPPKKLFVHSYILNKGQKTGKSLIEAGKQQPININEVIDKYTSEALRFYLLSSFPTEKDSEFDVSSLIESYNTNIVNGLGNLHYRCLPFVDENTKCLDLSSLTEEDKVFRDAISDLYKKATIQWNNYEHQQGIHTTLEIIKKANKFFDENKPWKLRKENTDKSQERINTIILITLECVAKASFLLLPVIPTICESILSFLGFTHHKLPDTDSLFTEKVVISKPNYPIVTKIG